MIGTSRSRKPPRPTSAVLAKGRRVSFAEPTTDQLSKETSAHLAESFTFCPNGSPEPTVAPYDRTADFGWARSHQEHDDGAAQSTTTLIGRPPPTGPFVEQPEGPYCVMAPPPFSRRPEAFEHFSEASVLLEDARNEPVRAALPSLSNFCITVLVTAVVTAAIVLALTMDLQGAFVRPRASSAPSGTGVGGRGEIVIPLEEMNVPDRAPERRVTAPPAVPAEGTTRVHLEAHNSTRPRLRQLLLKGTPRPKHRRGHRCGAGHFYSFCEQASRPEAYYSAAAHRCVSTAGDDAHVCNRGANRFADFQSCLSSCVYRGRQPASERCFEVTLFSGCSRQDVAGDWWFFDGSRCALWNFPQGKCPSQGSKVFRTRKDCDATCLRDDVANDDDDRHLQCNTPVSVPCAPWQIKFAYFADMRAQGHARCIKVSSRALLTRRCLIGSNRFDSLASCDRVCGSSRTPHV